MEMYYYVLLMWHVKFAVRTEDYLSLGIKVLKHFHIEIINQTSDAV